MITPPRPVVPYRIRLEHGSLLAQRLLDRARDQVLKGLKVEDCYFVPTGIPALDERIPRWPRISLLLGSDARVKSALLSRIAESSAVAGRPVLWLCAGGYQERALLTILARRARIELRRVFVKRDLTSEEWKRLEAATLEVGQLPLTFADAHGAEAEDLETAVCTAIVEGLAPRLVIIDQLNGVPKRALTHLERLSETVKVPFLLALDTSGTWPTTVPSVWESGLSPGSIALVFDREIGIDGNPSAGRRDGRRVIRRGAIGRVGPGVILDLDVESLEGVEQPRSARQVGRKEPPQDARRRRQPRAATVARRRS